MLEAISLDSKTMIIKSDKETDFSEIIKFIIQKENIKAGKSPLEDIPRIKLNITTQEIVELLRECRAGI